jgi:hypothetical protein
MVNTRRRDLKPSKPRRARSWRRGICENYFGFRIIDLIQECLIDVDDV